jgi:hypothetical protein
MRRPWTGLIASFLTTAVFLLIGAGESGVDEGADPDRFDITWVYGLGTPVEFTINLSRTDVDLSDSVTLLLEARHPADWSVTFPEIGNVLSGLLVRERREHPPRLDRAGSMVATREYVLEPMGPGLYVLPPMELLISEGEGEFGLSLRSDPVPIMVGSMLPEGQGEPNLLDMIILARPSAKWIRAAAPSVLLLFGAAAFLLVRHRRKRGAPSESTSPAVRAQDELKALLSDGLIDGGAHRELYDRMNRILRRFLGGYVERSTTGLTSDEILSALDTGEGSFGSMDAVRDIFAQCDRVKFRGHTPSRQETDRDLDRMRHLLENEGGGGER